MITSARHHTWTYDANNRLLSFNGTSFTYDKNGNAITKTDASGTTSYTYDYENRLLQATSSTLQANYSYDPFGKRLSKTVVGAIKYYLYDNEDIIAEYDSAGSVIASYTHGQGIDEPIKGLSPQGTVPEWYYTFDGLGSVVELTDSTGAVVESYKYDSFGNLEAPPATGNPYTYTGREYDGESGLYYYRARFYDARVGRFLTADPLLLPRINKEQYSPTFSLDWSILELIQSPNSLLPYGYVENNPVSRIDPYGLAWWDPSHWPFPRTIYCGGFTSGPGMPRSCIDACCAEHDACLKRAHRFCGNYFRQAVRKCLGDLFSCWGRCWRTAPPWRPRQGQWPDSQGVSYQG